MATIGSLVLELKATAATFRRNMRDATDALREHQAELRGISIATGAAATGLAFLGTKVADFAGKVAETRSLLQVTFGGQGAAEIRSWAQSTGDAVGRSAVQMEGFAGSLGALLTPMLGSRDAAQQLATTLSDRAVDMASFFNATDDEALIAIRAGLIGSSEPLQRFGVDLTEAALKEQLLAEGSDRTVQSLSRQEKVLLRYRALLEQSSLAQGDAARTADSYANQQKRLQGNLEDLSASIGQRLIPAFGGIVGKLNSVIESLDESSDEAKDFVVAIGGTITVVLGAAAALTGLGAALPAMSTGFDTLRSVVTSLFPAITSLKPALDAAKISLISLNKSMLPINVTGGIIAVAIFAVIAALGAFKQAVDADLFGLGSINNIFGKMADGLRRMITLIPGLGPLIEFIHLGGELAGIDFTEATKKVAALGKPGVETLRESFQTGLQTLLLPLRSILGSASETISETVSAGAEQGGEQAKKDIGHIGVDINEKVQEVLDFGGDTLRDAFDRLETEVNKNVIDFEGRGDIVGDLDVFELDNVMGNINRRYEEAMGAAAEVQAPMTMQNMFARMGATIDNITTQAADSSVGTFEDAFGVLGDAIASAAPRITSLINTAAQGFDSGGIWGAIIAVLVDLLTQTEAFNRIMERSNETLDVLIEALEPIMELLDPLHAAISSLVQVILKAVGTVLKPVGMIGSALSKAGSAIKSWVTGTEESVAQVSSFIRSQLGLDEPAESAIVTEFTTLTSALEQVNEGSLIAEAIKERMARLLEKAQERLTELQIERVGTGGLRKEDFLELRELPAIVNTLSDMFGDLAEDTGDLAENTDAMSDAVDNVTGSLTNVPRGFKIAAQRLAATDADTGMEKARQTIISRVNSGSADLPDSVNGVETSLSDAAGRVADAGSDLVEALSDAAMNITEAMQSRVETSLLDAAGRVADAVSDLIGALSGASTGITDAVQNFTIEFMSRQLPSDPGSRLSAPGSITRTSAQNAISTLRGGAGAGSTVNINEVYLSPNATNLQDLEEEIISNASWATTTQGPTKLGNPLYSAF